MLHDVSISLPIIVQLRHLDTKKIQVFVLFFKITFGFFGSVPRENRNGAITYIKYL